jgi:hypothetical protein
VFSLGKKFVRHVVPGVIKPIRVLWNEVIGFVFLVLAVVMGFSTYRKFGDLQQTGGSPLPLIAGFLFSALMLYFGLSSFFRARKISRS